MFGKVSILATVPVGLALIVSTAVLIATIVALRMPQPKIAGALQGPWGPFTWMFVLPEAIVVRLTVGPTSEETAIRLSYPGMGVHAGYMDAKQGLIVAYAHGPEEFVVSYDESTAPHADLLNTNLWVDFSGDMPTLFNKIH